VQPSREWKTFDLVLCNEKGLMPDVVFKFPQGNCDNDMIKLHIQFEVERNCSITSAFTLNKSNSNGIRQELCKVNLLNKLRYMSVDGQWQIFNQIVQNTQREFLPI